MGAGVAFALSAKRASSLPASASQLDAQAANERISRENTLAALFVGAGAAALAGGAVLWLWPTARTTTVSLVPSTGGGFVTASGRF